MNRKEFVKSVSLMGAASMVLPKYSFAAVKGSDKIKVAVVEDDTEYAQILLSYARQSHILRRNRADDSRHAHLVRGGRLQGQP